MFLPAGPPCLRLVARANFRILQFQQNPAVSTAELAVRFVQFPEEDQNVVAPKSKNTREAAGDTLDDADLIGDFFDVTISFGERIDPDERSAIGTCTIKTTTDFPVDQKASNIHLDVTLDALPDHTVIGAKTIGPFRGKSPGAVLRIPVDGEMISKTPDGPVPSATTSKTVELEVKTGIFAFLCGDPATNSITCAELASGVAPRAEPTMEPRQINVTLTYDLAFIKTRPIVGTQSAEDFTLKIIED